MADRKQTREICKVFILCILWYAVSSTNNVIGKTVLNEFPYPLTMTMVQLLSITVLSGPFFNLWGVRKYVDIPWNYYCRLIIPLAFGKFVASVFSHVSIWKVPVSYAHTAFQTHHNYRVCALLLADGVLNWFQNIIAFSVLSLVTPLTYAVANASKRIFVIGVSLFILGNPVTGTNIFGMVLAIAGVLCYNKAKYDQKQAENKQTVLPYTRETWRERNNIIYPLSNGMSNGNAVGKSYPYTNGTVSGRSHNEKLDFTPIRNKGNLLFV
nr:solute carrier family 35 member E1 homolog [Leptinotarsa decemlineata]